MLLAMRYVLTFLVLLPAMVMAQSGSRVSLYLDSIRETMRDDPDRVGYYLREAIQADSLHQKMHQRELADMVVTLDSLQAKSQLEENLRKKAEERTEAMRDANLLYGLIMFAGMAGIVVFLLVDRQRKQNRYEAELAKLKASADGLTSTHHRLFSILSRDLAAPAQAYANLVRSLNSSPDRANPEYLGRLRDQGLQVVQLLHGALEWTLVQTGQASLHRERFTAAIWAREAVDNCRPTLEDRSHNIELLVPENIALYGDRTTLAIALENAITELAANTPAKQVLTVFAGNKDDLVTIGVTSHGCTRPATEFNFKSTDHNKLWLADELVRRNAGKVIIEPATAGGVSIIFTLPR